MEEAAQCQHPEKGCGAAQNCFAWTLDWRYVAITAVLEQQIHLENSALEKTAWGFYSSGGEGLRSYIYFM